MKRVMAIFVSLGLALSAQASMAAGKWSVADERACLGSGGKVVQGLMGPACSRPTKDAGRACTDGDQCEGFCLDTGKGGQCDAFTLKFGCFPIIEDGRRVTICVD